MRALRAGHAFLSALLAAPALCQPAEAGPVEEYQRLFGSVSRSRLELSYRSIAKPPSRLAGSAGERSALEYAEARFRAMGLASVRREEFEVTVPDPEARGTLTFNGSDLELYPLWPNLVRTSTCDVRGRIVEGKSGSMEDLAGLPLPGSIVLLDFNSGSNWRNAAKLGAAAIVFVEPKDTDRLEAESKFAQVPLRIPRFYLRAFDARRVREAASRGVAARLTCRQDWVVTKSWNVIGDLPGTDSGLRSERIALMAYADSMSSVPGLARGAEAAGSLSVLLELAEIYRARPSRRPLTFVASGAHHLALKGAREFVERRILEGTPLFLGLTLEIDSGHFGLAELGRGWYYEYRDESQQPLQPLARVLRSHADRIAAVAGLPPREILLDGLNQSDGRTWRNIVPARFGLDCEPMVQAGYRALSLVTAESRRARRDTPFDTLDRVNFAHVVRQAQTAACLVYHLANDPAGSASNSPFKVPSEIRTPQRMSLIGGFATVEGRVAIYDPGRSFVPDASVPGSLAVMASRQKSLMGVRGDSIEMSRGADPRYRFIGVAPVGSYWHTEPRNTNLAAFRVNASTGEIDHAPSLGVLGAEAYPTTFRVKQATKSTPIIVFPCTSVDLYDLVDPQSLTPLAYTQVLESRSNAPPRDYGVYGAEVDPRQLGDPESAAVLFGTPGESVKLAGGTRPGEVRLLATFADAGKPEGVGLALPGRSEPPARPPFLARQSASDLQALNEMRLRRFDAHRVVSGGIGGLHREAGKRLALARAALARGDWAGLEANARAAWALALRVHPNLEGTATDMVRGVLVYLLLLVPFSYFLERLAFSSKTITRQLTGSGAIFLASFLLIRLVHPAFDLVSNPLMIFVAFITGSLSLLVITFIAGKFERSLKAIRQEQSGIREVDIGRAGVTMAAFALGIGNLRRRKARTFLTVSTLIITAFIVLSFTSIVPDVRLNEIRGDAVARYPGVLLRNPGLEPVQSGGYDLLRTELGPTSAVARRAWFFGFDAADKVGVTIRANGKAAEASAVSGMDPSETRVTSPQSALVPGGRWFDEGEDRVAILPTQMAEQIGVAAQDVGKVSVRIAGEDLRVVGLFDPAKLGKVTDLDGDPVLPADFSLSRQLHTEERSTSEPFRRFVRLDPEKVVLVPAACALRLGGEIRSVAVALPSGGEVRRVLEGLMPRLRLNLYGSVEGGSGLEVRQFSVLQGSKSSGVALVVVQLLIAGLFVMNTMIASVHERRKEIGILSSIGLAPNHIGALFLAESMVYGVVGSVFGYLVAQTVAKGVVAFDALPGLHLNFSLASALLSVAFVLGISVLSALYPARMAARIAAPAMNEAAFKTLPQGDVWQVELPFHVSRRHAESLVQFFADWFKGHEGYAIGGFVSAQTGASFAPESCLVETTIWPAPYDLGVSQGVRMEALPSGVEGICRLELTLTRIGGEYGSWIRVNRRFLGDVRRQFLAWRTWEEDQRGQPAQRSADPATTT